MADTPFSHPVSELLDISDTDPHTGKFHRIKAVDGAAVGDFAMASGSSLTAFTITQNDYLDQIKCISITLSSGRVLVWTD